ncbi:unnamed protein product, partial [Didymodactylos carnosus]
YYVSKGNSLISVILGLEWSQACDVDIAIRINGLPNNYTFDYKTTCSRNQSTVCTINIEQVAAFNWIYIEVAKESGCTSSVYSLLDVRMTDCSTMMSNQNGSCIRSYPTRRIMFNYYYDFLYVPLYLERPNFTPTSSSSAITMNKNNSIYAVEFIVDERNIGGTLNLDFDVRAMSSVSVKTNVSVYICLSKHYPQTMYNCEQNYLINIPKNSLTVRSIPYPEIALWYLTIQHVCNDSEIICSNSSLSVVFQITSSQCTSQQCGKYGLCRIMTSQQNVFSTCVCIAGYRGYACTDSSKASVAKSFNAVLFLTLSNLMFIPAIILALSRRLFIEALFYFFNMFFSTFYHACDQDIYKYCIFKYDGLQLTDFIGSYASFVITLITMATIPRTIKVFLFILGLLTCVAINARDRFDTVQFICLVSISFAFTVSTWIIVSVMRRRLHPTRKRLLLVIPGFLLAFAGVILFAFVETDSNYWYIHSIWHILMASSIMFFLPQKQLYKKENVELRTMTSLNAKNQNSISSLINAPDLTNIVNNQSQAQSVFVLAPPVLDSASVSSSITDTSKTSTDDLIKRR